MGGWLITEKEFRMPSFSRGDEAAEARASSGGFAGRLRYLSQDVQTGKDNPTFFRVISEREDLITADIHMGIPTKEKPDGYTGTWPAKMSAVCPNDKAFAVKDEKEKVIGWEQPDTHYGHCYIHEHMGDQLDQFNRPLSRASAVTHGLVVLRDPVRNDKGAVIGFKDKIEEYEDRDGNKHNVPAIRLAAQKWTNFWGPIKAANYISGTFCGRDYMMTKVGTEVTVTPLDPTPEHNPETPSWKDYTDAMDLMRVDVIATLAEQASEEHFARFFDPTKKAPERSSGKDKGAPDGSAPPAEADEDPPELQAQIEALRNRVKGNQAGTKTGPQA